MKARAIALYLPQFHPIPENDEWWGKGFTEWTNTAKAKPLFSGHYQPNVPADLGFYDLRVPETRIEQAEMARQYGIEAFCYYHYWFAGKRIIERPFNEVLASGQPDFPFCLCWANQTWTGIWHGAPNRILIEQTYPGMDDHRHHFNTALLPAFLDERYLKVEGKPVFIIHDPHQLPDSVNVTDLWRELAVRAGLPGLYLIAEHNSRLNSWNPHTAGFDAMVNVSLPRIRDKWLPWQRPLQKILNKYYDWKGIPTIYRYEDVIEHMTMPKTQGVKSFPCVIPNWDNTPRSGSKGRVLQGSTPDLFARHLKNSLDLIENVPFEERFIFIKSWNEWAEGNYLEPDLQFGRKYLEAMHRQLVKQED